MKKYVILSAAMLLAAGSVSAKSEKRGVSENEFRFVKQAEALAPGVGWYYNWGNLPHTSLEDYEDMEYVPMCWNGNFNAEAIREYCKKHPNVKYLLGFNEPNFVSQSNMTPQEAAEKWPAVKALADELGLKLVAPAVNYSPDTWQPLPWMEEFTRLVGEDAYDYLAVHGYGGLGAITSLAESLHDRFGKEVWVTEFCYWPGESGYVAPETQISAMINMVAWLEKTPWIYRYAWFKAVGSSNSKSGPNYGLLMTGRGDEPRELSRQGYVYVYMSDFDADKYYTPGETVSAADYISAEKISLDKSSDPAAPKPIEISQFNSGAWADYQFDVAEAGVYNLVLTVSGEGDPKRFNPCIAVYSVDAEGKETLLCQGEQFALSGSNDVYTSKVFTLTLPAGRQTLRLKDMYPFQPSGIRISTLSLQSPAAIGDIESEGYDYAPEYFNLQGMRVANPVKGEIYIVRNQGVTRKIIY